MPPPVRRTWGPSVLIGSMSYVKYLRLDSPAEGVCRVLLDRPARRNAVDLDMVEELYEAVSGCKEPALLIGSTDERAFCSGGDLSVEPEILKKVSSRLYDFYLEMLGLGSVMVAAVNGNAVGAGAQILLACDVRIGASGARISFAGVGTGLALGTWGLPSNCRAGSRHGAQPFRPDRGRRRSCPNRPSRPTGGGSRSRSPRLVRGDRQGTGRFAGTGQEPRPIPG